ncbi:hypothetical protein AB6C47_018095 [Vibrio cyclitrophicus]
MISIINLFKKEYALGVLIFMSVLLILTSTISILDKHSTDSLRSEYYGNTPMGYSVLIEEIGDLVGRTDNQRMSVVVGDGRHFQSFSIDSEKYILDNLDESNVAIYLDNQLVELSVDQKVKLTNMIILLSVMDNSNKEKLFSDIYADFKEPSSRHPLNGYLNRKFQIFMNEQFNLAWQIDKEYFEAHNVEFSFLPYNAPTENELMGVELIFHKLFDIIS